MNGPMVHGGRVHRWCAEDHRGPADILDFSANLHPLGPPMEVWRALEAALPLIRHYPDDTQQHVKQVLAEYYDVEPDTLVCGNGATEVMELIVRTIRPTRIWVLEPAFAEYEAIAQRMRIPVQSLPLSSTPQYNLPLAELDGQVRAGELVVLNTPHNPSGWHWPKATWFTAVKQWTQAGRYVLIDESFLDFLPDAALETTVREATVNPHWFTVKSATKLFAIPGLRFGFAIMHPTWADRINTLRDGWSVNSLAQAAAAAAYRTAHWMHRTQTWLSAEQAYIRDTWQRHPAIRVHPFSVNFFLVKCPAESAGQQLTTSLRQAGLYVRSCASFPTLDSSYLRIAIRSHEENVRLWETAAPMLEALIDDRS
ncbi:threonine-phosphate decarboxylase [Alicyclobacillus contaminans]|uniref:pyridoxal phosphate-dependent aminotransferase n=1 Tax=Alicyclobacillus contaminans TaxID=392016 RepID=UPI000425ED0C|nr:aminotransferase class I/II-fold pyridoxal phosphate-dependent enzyme [Alicyclobacillus contaminans]GMA48780.1 threonine-phosphate decarboxylase [Alicyclobacillus contaminans]